MELVALLSSGEDTWSQVSGLMSQGTWDKIIILGDGFGQKFSHGKNFDYIKIDLEKRLIDLKKECLINLNGKINGTEVALTIASGSGKEHMALISSLLSIPVGIRFVALTKDGIVYL